MEITLDKNTRAVAYAAAKEDGRPVLECVHLAKREIQAANGFVLARRKLAEKTPGLDILLPALQILGAKDIGNTLPKVILEIGKGKKPGTLLTKDFIKQTITKVEGSFPKVDQLMPDKKKQPAVEVTIAVDILKTLIKIAGSADRIKFKFYSATEGFYYECRDPGEDNNTYGMAMPMHNGA